MVARQADARVRSKPTLAPAMFRQGVSARYAVVRISRLTVGPSTLRPSCSCDARIATRPLSCIYLTTGADPIETDLGAAAQVESGRG